MSILGKVAMAKVKKKAFIYFMPIILKFIILPLLITIGVCIMILGIAATVDEVNKSIVASLPNIDIGDGSNLYPVTGTGKYAVPYPDGTYFVVTAEYGETDSVHKSPHNGIDLAAADNSPVIAIGKGTVISAGDLSDGYGISVVIRLEENLYVRYGHLWSANVKQGDIVVQGQKIGNQGSTGYSTGSHLHLEFLSAPGYGVRLNPRLYINFGK